MEEGGEEEARMWERRILDVLANARISIHLMALRWVGRGEVRGAREERLGVAFRAVRHC